MLRTGWRPNPKPRNQAKASSSVKREMSTGLSRRKFLRGNEAWIVCALLR